MQGGLGPWRSWPKGPAKMFYPAESLYPETERWPACVALDDLVQCAAAMRCQVHSSKQAPMHEQTKRSSESVWLHELQTQVPVATRFRPDVLMHADSAPRKKNRKYPSAVDPVFLVHRREQQGRTPRCHRTHFRTVAKTQTCWEITRFVARQVLVRIRCTSEP